MKNQTTSRKTESANAGSLPRLVRHFVVLWDDEQGVCCPMGWDDDCTGSLCCINKTIAIFESRTAAQKAINISAKFAQLRLAQGLPVNPDFIGSARKNLRIVECVPNAAGEPQPPAEQPKR